MKKNTVRLFIAAASLIASTAYVQAATTNITQKVTFQLVGTGDSDTSNPLNAATKFRINNSDILGLYGLDKKDAEILAVETRGSAPTGETNIVATTNVVDNVTNVTFVTNEVFAPTGTQAIVIRHGTNDTVLATVTTEAEVSVEKQKNGSFVSSIATQLNDIALILPTSTNAPSLLKPIGIELTGVTTERGSLKTSGTGTNKVTGIEVSTSSTKVIGRAEYGTNSLETIVQGTVQVGAPKIVVE